MSDSMSGKKVALARRQALSKGGKAALAAQAPNTNTAPVGSPAETSAKLTVKERRRLMSQMGKVALPNTDRTRASIMANDTCDGAPDAHKPEVQRKVNRSATAVTENSQGRSVARARREALASQGKRALTGNQDAFGGSLSGRAAAKALREERSRYGAKNQEKSGARRPVRGARDASWKVSSSMTDSGNEVSGTSLEIEMTMTGSDRGVCQSVTGTDYFSGDAFENACKQPESSRRSATRLSDTTQGNVVSGNELGATERLTGNRTGMCQSVTGTEYMAAGQFSVCNANARQFDATDASDQTMDGLFVSGGERNHSKVTGTESSSIVSMTGSQYLSQGSAARQLSHLNGQTLRNPERLSGDVLNTNSHVTGDTRTIGGQVTGDNFVANNLTGRSRQSGTRQRMGGSRISKERISGSMPQRGYAVTGDEPGTCQHLTGTPYVGRDIQNAFCQESAGVEPAQRIAGRPISGIQPGVANGVTGDARGADHPISGTPYHGEDQLHNAFGLPVGSEEVRGFSISTPARQATLVERDQNARVTGSFGRAEGKVTGSDEANFHSGSRNQHGAAEGGMSPPTERRVTGEGLTHGITITGDDWDRNGSVTGTEGRSAMSRNQTRRGEGTLRAIGQPARVEREVSRVTGSSGNTSDGAFITYSGGARG